MLFYAFIYVYFTSIWVLCFILQKLLNGFAFLYWLSQPGLVCIKKAHWNTITCHHPYQGQRAVKANAQGLLSTNRKPLRCGTSLNVGPLNLQTLRTGIYLTTENLNESNARPKSDIYTYVF